MSNKETNIAEATKKPDTLILLEKRFAEADVILHPIYNTLFYFMYNRTDKDKHYRLLIEVFENSFFIKITDLEWHKVSMDNQRLLQDFYKYSFCKLQERYEMRNFAWLKHGGDIL